MKRRDSAIEFCRILASLIVIGVHIMPPVSQNGNWYTSRSFLALCLADGVAVFWMITGAFLLSSDDYISLLKRLLKKIILPLVLWCLFWFYLKPFLLDGVSLSDSLQHSYPEYSQFLMPFFRWSVPLPELDYLWYLFTYAIVILLQPLLKRLGEFLDRDHKRELSFAGIIALLLFFNDLSHNELFHFSNQLTVLSIFPSVLFVLWGHILYRNRELFKKKRYIPVSVLLFLFLNVLRTVIQAKRIFSGINDTWLMYWFSLFGLLCASCILIFSFSLFSESIIEKTEKVILSVSSKTFTIYILHVFVIRLLEKWGYQSFLYGLTVSIRPALLGDVIYCALLIPVVFGVSYLVSLVFSAIFRLFRR